MQPARVSAVLGVGALISVLAAGVGVQVGQLYGQPPIPTAAVNLAYWNGWSLLALPVQWLCYRFTLGRQPVRRALAVYVAAALAFSFVHVLIAGAAFALFWPGAQRDWIVWTIGITNRFVVEWELTVFAALVGLFHARLYRDQARERARAAERLESKLAEAKLQILTHQLQPHFVSNLLNAVSSVMHRDLDAADYMLERLGTFLRATLQAARATLVPLAVELQHVRLFVDIERVRFGDRVRLLESVSPEADAVLVPPLLLQPLVENAIRHGCLRSASSCEIALHAALDNARVIITVKNPAPPTESSVLGTGIGLANTRDRLAAVYGNDFSFDTGRDATGQFVVSLSLPITIAAAAI